MIKSIGSVFENSIISDSTLGHLFNMNPYIEPAANMVFAHNIFANISGASDFTVNQYTSATLANSGAWSKDTKLHQRYGFTNLTSPSLNDPVVKFWDYNMFFG